MTNGILVRTAAGAGVLAAMLTAGPARAQEAPPPERTVRLENPRVRVVEVRYPPGAFAPLHAHRHGRVVYVLEGGVLELVSARGDTARLRVAPGQTVWRPAERHTVRNVGGTLVRVLETEVKGGGPEG